MPQKKHSDAIDRELCEALGKPLTRGELAVLKVVLDGHTTSVQAATALGVTVRTVRTHLTHIYAKTGADNLAALVLMALGRKLCAVDLSDIVW